VEKKEKKRMFISLGGTSGNVSYFNCCWFELAMTYANESTQESLLVSKRHTGG
jgi:hypothetical protein